MNKKIVYTESAPKAIGPYSQGIEADGLFYFSGQIAIDPKDGKLIEGDEAEQTRQIFRNIAGLLGSQGLSFDNVIKTTVFLTDMGSFAAVNGEYAKYFTSAPPARSCVAVSGLPLGAKVEIEIIAKK